MPLSPHTLAGRPSARTNRAVERSTEALHALGVPVVCSADGDISGVALALWLAADYRIAVRSAAFLAGLAGSAIAARLRQFKRFDYMLSPSRLTPFSACPQMSRLLDSTRK